MAYLCLNCFEIYKFPSESCPKASCHGFVIEVDDLMLPTIMLLNQKGYPTEFCCSGHVDGCKECYPYITFDSFLNEVLSNNEFKELFKGLPECWTIEEKDRLNRMTLRSNVTSDNMVELQNKICYVNLKLLEFVNTLPSLCDEEE